MSLTARAWNAPTISSPAQGNEVFVGILLNWTAVNASAGYQRQIDTSASFNSPLFNSITKTYINSSSGNSDTEDNPANLRFGQKYYWRVRAFVAGDTSVWVTSDFTTRDFVTQTSPNSTDTWTGVNINWGVHTGILFYDMQIDTSQNFNSPLSTTITKNYINSSDGNSDTDHFINNLLFGTTYYWRVRARNAVDTSRWESVWSFNTRDFVNQTSPNNTDTWTGLTINWAVHTGILFYDMQIDTSQNFNSPLSTTITKNYINSSDGNSDTEHFINNLLFGTTYYWRVRARNAVDTSRWESVWSFNTRDFVNQTSPNNTDTWTGLTINWAVHNGVSFYDMQADTSASFNSPALRSVTNAFINSSDGNSDTESFISDLFFGRTYYWRVRARNAVDTSSWSTVWTFNTRNFVNLTSPADGNLNTSLNPTLNWAPHNGIDVYNLQVDVTNQFNSAGVLEYNKAYINSSDGNSDTQQGIGPLQPNTVYFWRVRAIHANDTSAWTVRWFSTGTGTPQFPATPVVSTSFCSSSAPSNTPTLTWQAVSGAGFYEIELNPSTIPLSGNPDITQITSTSVETASLLENASYCYSVRAVTNGIAGNWSQPCCFLVPGQPTISQAFVNESSYCEGADISFSAEISGTFQPQNEFIVELSDQTGNFATPVELGTFNTLQAVYSFPLPENSSGNNFRIRIVSVNPQIVGTPSLAFSIATNPELEGDLNLFACAQLSSIELPQILPAGGTYGGDFVDGNTFSPSSSGSGSFEVSYTFTNPQGCSAQLTGIIQVDACTNLQEVVQVSQWGRLLQINSKSNHLESFQLYDLQGKLILNIKSDGHLESVNLMDLPSGLYIYQVSGKNLNQTGKVFIR